MNGKERQSLTQIVTDVGLLLKAQGDGAEAKQARVRLLEHYGTPILQLLNKKGLDVHAAGALCSDFALALLEGAPFLKRFSKKRGYFRYYLQGVIGRMIVDHHRAQQRKAKKEHQLPSGDLEPAAPCRLPEPSENGSDPGADTMERWQLELGDQAMEALAENERERTECLDRMMAGLHALQKKLADDAQAGVRIDLLIRYRAVVYDFLYGKVRNSADAGDLCGNFADNVAECEEYLEMHAVRPDSFRSYLYGILGRTVSSYYRQRGKIAIDAEDGDAGLGAAEDQRSTVYLFERLDSYFLKCWRHELVNQSLEALAEDERQIGRPYFTIINLKRENPAISVAQLTEQLNRLRGESLKESAVRQMVHRSRQRYAELIIAEVIRSLRTLPGDNVGPEKLEQELIDLGLFSYYVRRALER